MRYSSDAIHLVALAVLAAGCGASVPGAPLGDDADDCVSFTKRSREAWQTGRILAPGASPSLPLTAYWFGSELAERRAVLSVEDRLDPGDGGDPVYRTYYEFPGAGCRSGYLATGDENRPLGEIVVVAMPLSSPFAQTDLRILNGKNGLGGKRPVWPRFTVELADGTRASVIPARGEIDGMGGFRGFFVVAGDTFVSVGGQKFSDEEIRELVPALAEPDGPRPAAPGADGEIGVDDAKEFPDFTLYSPGRWFDDLPLTAVLRRLDDPDTGEDFGANFVAFVYGDCEARDDGGCATPLEVQVWPACERNLASYALPHDDLTVRGVPAARFPDRLELYTGDVTVVIFGDRRRQTAAAEALQPVNALAASGERLRPPVQGAVEGTLPCR